LAGVSRRRSTPSVHPIIIHAPEYHDFYLTLTIVELRRPLLGNRRDDFPCFFPHALLPSKSQVRVPGRSVMQTTQASLLLRLHGAVRAGEVRDRLDRPVRLNRGEVIQTLFTGGAS
jgi:hypothetical protein